MENKKSSKFGLGLIFGMISGAVAGLLLAPKTGKKMRKELSKAANEIRDRLEESDIKTTVREIFDDVTEKSFEIFEDSMDTLSTKLSEVSEKWQTIDKEKYSTAVKEVIDQVKDIHKVPENTLLKLKKYLENDFEKLATSKKTTTQKNTKSRK
ncbi:hypothetical protein A3J15_00150 [Candidatus Roizmanbacteria bacterium RIFCSPLOWO2_02_FULL_38_10]|uniref:Gas vesicle protein n=1 Tax=Candidatus Roizmanbacteria bacterium RIFCSPLOWO2_02_FULL_38_10 TaxID=1802074 RepID=A0A1F7JND9_9BACT|nr:MAG: hypothetical protein A3J15_00150 [Candidatus Roizmanbacteria bacterium RIFCSPLOWO2_02_FULL_38_10]